MARTNLDRYFKELFASLNSAGVRYLVIGGYAVNFHGYHRSTNDMDVWIAADPTNAQRISLAIQGFGGYRPKDVEPTKFSMGKMVMLGVEPFRIDILTSPIGIQFEECYERRVISDWDGVLVPVISLDDLKTNKRQCGRAKDLADLENLPPSSIVPEKTTKKSKRRKKP